MVSDCISSDMSTFLITGFRSRIEEGSVPDGWEEAVAAPEAGGEVIWSDISDVSAGDNGEIEGQGDDRGAR